VTLTDDTRHGIIEQARARQGIPYRLDPPPDGVMTLDCSLFVLQVLSSAGVPLPAGVRTAEQIRQATVPVAFSDVLPGDLLFFEGTYDASGPAGPDGRIASHIGFSLGAGTRRMLDANDGRGNVGETNIGTDYWQSKLFEARRPPGLANEAKNLTANIPRGIDVASWQGQPDWRQVAASGVQFAITKATEGVGYLNPTFARNWLEIRSAGIKRGAYHFAELGANTPEAEADYFLANVSRVGGLAAGDMLALDLEDKDGSLKRANDVGGWALAWLRYVERQTGVVPLLYTGAHVVSEHGLTDPAFARYPLWLAAYRETPPPVPPPWARIALWQHTDKGSVPGIVGNVDLNRFLGTAEQLAALGKPGAVAQPAYARPGDVGEGLLAWCAELGTEPAAPSTFLPLGRSPAIIEELVCLDGSVLRWHLPTGRRWSYKPEISRSA